MGPFPKEKNVATVRDISSAMLAPADYANATLVIRGSNDMVRIAFGEAFGPDGSTFHRAVVMHSQDAAEMASALLDALDPDRIQMPEPVPQAVPQEKATSCPLFGCALPAGHEEAHQDYLGIALPPRTRPLFDPMSSRPASDTDFR